MADCDEIDAELNKVIELCEMVSKIQIQPFFVLVILWLRPLTMNQGLKTATFTEFQSLTSSHREFMREHNGIRESTISSLKMLAINYVW